MTLDIPTIDQAIAVIQAAHHPEPRRFSTVFHTARILDPYHVDRDECWYVADIPCGLCDGECKALPPLLNLRARAVADYVHDPTKDTEWGVRWVKGSDDQPEIEPHRNQADAIRVHHVYPRDTVVVTRTVAYGPWTDRP